MRKEKSILYAGIVADANTATNVHVVRNAKLFTKNGMNVRFCGEHSKNNVPQEYEGFLFSFTKPIKGKGKLRGAKWNWEQITGFGMTAAIKREIKRDKPDIIILYDPASIVTFLRINRLCRKMRMRLVVEVTEWPEGEDFHGKDKILWWQRNFRKSYLDKKCGYQIVISKMLEQHYREQGNHVLLLPPIYQEQDFVKERQISRVHMPLKLVFAGTLAKKDYLLSMINAVQYINQDDEKRVEFSIIGPSKEELNAKAMIESAKGIKIMGRLPHEEVLRIVADADFSVLLRENKRYAKAGVSTKFSEAMCLGIPSICTSVGGTDLYVEDGVNGILVQDNEVETIVSALNRILRMDMDCIQIMKKNALKTAQEHFFDIKYNEQIKAFFNEI